MIRVEPAPEPPEFDRKVRQPGLSAIAEMVGEPQLSRRRGRRRTQIAERREEIPSQKFPPFWRDAIDDMMFAYDQICAYMAIYIEKVTGAAYRRSHDSAVDRMEPGLRVGQLSLGMFTDEFKEKRRDLCSRSLPGTVGMV